MGNKAVETAAWRALPAYLVTLVLHEHSIWYRHLFIGKGKEVVSLIRCS